MGNLKDLVSKIKGLFEMGPATMSGGQIPPKTFGGGASGGRGVAGNWRPVPTPTPARVPTPTPVPQNDIEQKIKSGLRAYADKYAGGQPLPIEDYVPQFVQATEKYPIFKQFPFLLPQISILESSAGRNVTRENNPLNWGARLQKQGDYSPGSWEQSINDAITAIAGARQGEDPARQRTASYYEPFRQSGDLQTFADIYEPANKEYGRNLIEGIKLFEEQK